MKGYIIAISAAVMLALTAAHFLIPSNGSRLLQVPEVEATWVSWKQKWGKSYGTSSDDSYRKSVFANHYAYINEHNAEMKAKYGDHPDNHILGLTQFADLPNDEFRVKFTGLKTKNTFKANQTRTLPTDNLPAAVDWRKNGAVTPVKNQGQCGSCWTFSATGAMEGSYYNKFGRLESFSEQQFVDCVKTNGCDGCNGGLMDEVFKYSKNHDNMFEAEYSYQGRNGSCKQKDGSGIRVKNYYDVPANNADQLKAALAKTTVSVAVDGASVGFQLYFGGVVEILCGSDLDHGVLAVGYDHSWLWGDYFIVKNSWGSWWGESGYIRIHNNGKKNDANTCGIAAQPSWVEF